MPVSPLCLVADGAGPFNPTLNGVDVGQGDTISIELNDPTGVVDWFLEITGTDELSSPPGLTGVDAFHHVATPGTIVTFSYPNAPGRALLFASTVTGPGGPLTTTFAIFSLTAFATRVGAAGEEREGSLNFGWVTKTNPLIRAGSFVAGGDLIGTPTNQQVAQVTGSGGVIPLLAPEILFSGGLDLGGNPRPGTDALRDGLQTTDATPNQVLNTVTPANGQMIRVISEVMAVRTDVAGDAAWFILKGVWLRTGGSLTVVRAPVVVDSGSTAGAATWTAQLAANVTAVETQVTGEAAKTIHWSVLREYVEAS